MQRLDSLSNIAQDYIIPLHHLSLLSVSGEQRDDYLHGQLTVNTKKLGKMMPDGPLIATLRAKPGLSACYAGTGKPFGFA